MTQSPQEPQELDCPKRWPFDMKWEKSIEKNIGWSEVENMCGVRGADTEIKSFLTYDGLRAFEKVIIQNQYARNIASSSLTYESVNASDVDWQMGNTWEKLLIKLDLVQRAYGIESAPAQISSALEFSSQFIKSGVAHAKEIINYIEFRKREIATRKQLEAEKQRQEFRSQRASKWEQIDIDHSAVETGFIYVLENPLMPGIYKIGFTATNPDKRSEQISEQYNLPARFSVVQYWRTRDPFIVEQRVHKELADTRRGGEFFAADLDNIRMVVQGHLLE
jgi:T5orf172 domain